MCNRFGLGIILLFITLAGFSQTEPIVSSESSRTSLSSNQPFRIVVLPDTQYYASTYPSIFTAQIQWIVNNHTALNIQFVVHEGDITDNNSATQWQNAQNSMRLLDGIVPYSVLPGNHDMGTGATPADTRDTTLYNQYFPLSHYSGTLTFGGVYTAEPTKYDNNYHTFNASGTDWLVLSLEFGPRNDVLTWADNVVSSHPNHRVIIVTHDYIYSNETRQDTSESWDPHSYGIGSDPAGTNNGEEMWKKLVRKYSNISFVLNGHVLNDGQGHLVSVGDHGNKVYQMLCNYQMLTNGGNGYLRILEFDPDNHRVSATSYSPTLGTYLTDWQNQFVFENVDLSPPPSSTYTPTNVLYHNNFDDGTFTGYTIIDEGTLEGPSNWSLTSVGEILQSSNVYGPSSTATSGRLGTFAIYNNPSAFNWSNYSVHLTLRSTDNDGIGVMFYYTDANNYYKLDLDLQRTFIKVFKKMNGVESTIANVTASAPYTTGEDFNIDVSVYNGQISAKVKQVDIFGGPISDSSLTKGTFCLYDWGNMTSLFDDVLVESLEPSTSVASWEQY